MWNCPGKGSCADGGREYERFTSQLQGFKGLGEEALRRLERRGEPGRPEEVGALAERASFEDHRLGTTPSDVVKRHLEASHDVTLAASMALLPPRICMLQPGCRRGK